MVFEHSFTLVRHSTFQHNNGSAFFLTSSDLMLNGHVTFKENFAKDRNGAAISINGHSSVGLEFIPHENWRGLGVKL